MLSSVGHLDALGILEDCSNVVLVEMVVHHAVVKPGQTEGLLDTFWIWTVFFTLQWHSCGTQRAAWLQHHISIQITDHIEVGHLECWSEVLIGLHLDRAGE